MNARRCEGSLYTLAIDSVNDGALMHSVERVQAIGVAVDALARVLQTIQTIEELPIDDEEMAKLTSGYVMGGIYSALAELGDAASAHASRMESILLTARSSVGAGRV